MARFQNWTFRIQISLLVLNIIQASFNTSKVVATADVEEPHRIQSVNWAEKMTQQNPA